MRNPALAIVLAVVCAGSAAPAFAKDKTDEQVQSARSDDGHAAAAGDKAERHRKICKLETVTGSVLPRRVCRTVATIEAQPAHAVSTQEAAQD